MPKGWASCTKAPTPWSLCDLPEELLHEIVACLPMASLACCVNVSYTVQEAFQQDAVWKHISLCQWPSAAPSCGTWRDFVQNGGGERLGKVLLKKLQRMADRSLRCPERHELQRFEVRSGHFNCDKCGFQKTISPKHECLVVWGCRKCNYDHCEQCVKGSVMETAQGAANAGSGEGWTSLHYACRHGLTDLATSLLDSRADVEVKDFYHGYTPLMVSATHGHVDICSLLLSRGAAKETLNKFGKTAHACATSWCRTDLLPMLCTQCVA